MPSADDFTPQIELSLTRPDCKNGSKDTRSICVDKTSRSKLSEDASQQSGNICRQSLGLDPQQGPLLDEAAELTFRAHQLTSEGKCRFRGAAVEDKEYLEVDEAEDEGFEALEAVGE